MRVASPSKGAAGCRAATGPALQAVGPVSVVMIALSVSNAPRTGYLSTIKPLLEYMRSIPTASERSSNKSVSDSIEIVKYTHRDSHTCQRHNRKQILRHIVRRELGRLHIRRKPHQDCKLKGKRAF